MEIDRQVLQLVPHYYRLWIPDANPEDKLPLLVALHGYGGDMDSMMNVAKGVAADGMIVASVQGPHQFLSLPLETGNLDAVGFGWQTRFRPEDSVSRHHLLVRRVIREVTALYNADGARVFLMGFSQACALNYRLVFTHPTFFRGVIGVCGGIPGDFDEPKYRRYDGSILHIAATRDQYYPLEKSRGFAKALRRLASDVTLHEYDVPHVFPRRSIPYIRRWIFERLEPGPA